MDLEKAFDRVDRKGLWDTLESTVMPFLLEGYVPRPLADK